MNDTIAKNFHWETEHLDLPYKLPNLINTDSRTITQGQWFLPIVGANLDGHKFIQDAISKGASGFFCEKNQRDRLPHHLLKLGIYVENTFTALQSLAKWWRAQMSDCQVIGITGSSGKTTLKELCAQMLEQADLTLKTEGSFNNELGVPLTLCRLTEKHKFAVIEMGARRVGDITFLSQIVNQNIGVLANVGTAHLGEFGGVENILKAKMEISHASKCVYLYDDERIRRAMQALTDRKVYSFGFHQGSDVRIKSSQRDGRGGMSLEFDINGKALRLACSYYHEAHASNLACSLAVGLALGLDVESCIPGLQTFHGVKGRFQVIRKGELTLIDDAYNANPQSMKMGLETLMYGYNEGKIIVILGDMKELGPDEIKMHQELGRFCASTIKHTQLVTVGHLAKFIADGAREAGMVETSILSYPDLNCLLSELDSLVDNAQVLYVKASNSLKLGKVIETILQH